MKLCLYTFLSLISFQISIADNCAHWDTYNINNQDTNTFNVVGDKWYVVRTLDPAHPLEKGDLSDIPIADGWTSVDNVVAYDSAYIGKPDAPRIPVVFLIKGNKWVLFNPASHLDDSYQMKGEFPESMVFDHMTAVEVGDAVEDANIPGLHYWSVQWIGVSEDKWTAWRISYDRDTGEWGLSGEVERGSLSGSTALEAKGWNTIQEITASRHEDMPYVVSVRYNSTVFEYVTALLDGTPPPNCPNCSGSVSFDLCGYIKNIIDAEASADLLGVSATTGCGEYSQRFENKGDHHLTVPLGCAIDVEVEPACDNEDFPKTCTFQMKKVSDVVLHTIVNVNPVEMRLEQSVMKTTDVTDLKP